MEPHQDTHQVSGSSPPDNVRTLALSDILTERGMAAAGEVLLLGRDATGEGGGFAVLATDIMFDNKATGLTTMGIARNQSEMSAVHIRRDVRRLGEDQLALDLGV